MRPRYMTRIRSESEKISSRSAEMTKTARPASRISTSMRWIASIAPMSTPCEGCSATITRAPRVSSRASWTFCWLPPESELAGVSRSAPRTSNFRSARWRASPRRCRRQGTARARTPRDARRSGSPRRGLCRESPTRVAVGGDVGKARRRGRPRVGMSAIGRPAIATRPAAGRRIARRCTRRVRPARCPARRPGRRSRRHGR